MIRQTVKDLARAQGRTIADVEREAGLTPGTIEKWDLSIPRADRLAAVAKALHTTSEALLDPEADESAVNE